MNLALVNQSNPVLEARLAEVLAPPYIEHETLKLAMQSAVLNGGKRLRPFLLLESAKLFNIPREQSLDIACALELIHCYSLVHDDLPAMDDDDFRRGKPTIHKQFDEATAILVGDGLQSLAFELIANANLVPFEIRCRLILELAKASGPSGMVAGQMMDMQPIESKSMTMEGELNFIQSLQAKKTGALIGFAVRAGALLGKADAPFLTALSLYGQALGLCFQITDDLLDKEGNLADLGKATQKDDEAGKITFITALGQEGARTQAKLQAEKAKSALSPFINHPNYHRPDSLIALADWVMSRKH